MEPMKASDPADFFQPADPYFDLWSLGRILVAFARIPTKRRRKVMFKRIETLLTTYGAI